jgi:pantetheine-phosphate adenylyltransferase
VSDYEKECQMALINRKLNPKLDTMFLPARQNFTYLSSSVVKEMARYGVSLNGFLPQEIAEDVQTRMNEFLQKSQS